MKSLVGKIGTLALVAMAGVAVAACSSTIDKQGSSKGSPKAGERVGNVRLGLQPVAGITINNVNFVVTQGATTISSGVLPTPGTSDNFSFGLPLPVGTGYNLSLSAVSAETGDDVTCTGAVGPFNVLPNATTAFDITLTCVNNTNGQIIGTVNVETDSCPNVIVDYVIAIPAVATLPDGTIALAASARDIGNPAAALTYTWSIAPTSVGDFTPATGASTTLNCNGAGSDVPVSVTVSNGSCDTVLNTTVSCVAAGSCGNGTVEPALGETCDTALDPTCPADCNRVCGDGIAELGEECDIVPQNPAVCSATCQLVDDGTGGTGGTGGGGTGGSGGAAGGTDAGGTGGTTAGTGGTDAGGTDAGGTGGTTGGTDAGGTAGSGGTGPIVCGDGAVGAGEECDTTTPSAACSGECESVSTTECLDCEQAGDCFEFFDNCNAFTGADRTLCYDVTQCIQDTNCYDGTNSLGSCFCGTIPSATCGAAPLTGAGSPNGACKDLILQGLAPVATSAQVLGLLTATGRPAGGAMARLQCQKTANDTACLSSCGFSAGGPAFP